MGNRSNKLCLLARDSKTETHVSIMNPDIVDQIIFYSLATRKKTEIDPLLRSLEKEVVDSVADISAETRFQLFRSFEDSTK